MDDPSSPIPSFAPPISTLKILQLSHNELADTIARLALQFAVLGQLDVALRLVSRLNNFDKFHTRTVVLRPLWIWWDSRGTWPDGEEERVMERIEGGQRGSERAGEEEGGERASKHRKTQETGQSPPITREQVHQEVLRLAEDYAKGWWFTQKPTFVSTKGDQFVAREAKSPHDGELKTHKQVCGALRGILKALDSVEPEEHKDSTTGYVAMNVSAGYASAFDLRVLLDSHEAEGEEADEEKDLPSTMELLGTIAKRLEANQQITYLAQSRRACGYLADGLLSRLIGVEQERLDAFTKELEDALDKRIQNGRLVLSDVPLQELMDILYTNSRTSAKAKLAMEDCLVRNRKEMFREPATEAQIADAEKRLGVELPADFKSFVRLSNGCGQIFGGILFEPEIYPLEKLRWFSDDEDYFYDLDLALPNDFEYGRGFPDEIKEDWPKVGKAIEIGTEDIDNTWLIPPETVDKVKVLVAKVLDGDYPEETKSRVRNVVQSFAGSLEAWRELGWCCVTWASGGAADMRSYPSFGAYLRQLAEDSGAAKDDVAVGEGFVGYKLVQPLENVPFLSVKNWKNVHLPSP